MVERGQFLERMTVIAAGEHTLEGLYQAGGGGDGPVALVIGGHVALGGPMETPVPTEVCWALSRRGVPTLRFNYRGVGASTGARALPALAPDDLAAALELENALAPFVEDARAALEHLQATHPDQPVITLGYSFGAWVAAHLAAAEDLSHVGLIAPPVGVRPGLLAAALPPHDALVICGGADHQGRPEAVRQELGEGFFVVQIPDADPTFRRGLSELGERVAARFAAPANGLDEGSSPVW